MATREKFADATYRGGMRFDITAGSGHTLTVDTTADEGGENAGFSPMELLVVGLAGCTGMDVISILKKQRQDVTGYEIHVHGTRRAEHPMTYEHVTVEHVVTGRGIDPKGLARAIELSETKYCGVSNTLNKTATLEVTYRIVEAEGPE
jgi:putative redox protein